MQYQQASNNINGQAAGPTSRSRSPDLSATNNSMATTQNNNHKRNNQSVVTKGVPATSSVRYPTDAQYRVDDMFPDIPEVLEFESWWTEMSNGKIMPASGLTSQSRVRSSFATMGAAGGSRTSTGAPSSGAAATNPTSAVIAKTAAIKIGRMGPSGANIVSLGTTRRFMSITYHPQSNQFHILTDDGKVPLVIAVRDRYDEPLQPWHLHIGAVIDVLGRPTTLMSASGTTLLWLNNNAKRLWQMKMTLEKRVNQFRGRPRVDLDAGVFKPLWESNPALGGKVPLYKIANTIASLDIELQAFRQ